MRTAFYVNLTVPDQTILILHVLSGYYQQQPTTTTYLLSIDWRYNEFYILLLHQHKYQYSEWTVQIRFPKP